MSGYTKLFSSILTSTIWLEAAETRIVWITMLAMADKRGIVEGSVPGLAHIAGVTMEATLVALTKFLAPDPHSRSPEAEGRRIQAIDGGWLLLNHAKYRAKMGADERREYLRLKKAESRARNRSGGVKTCQQKSTIVVDCPPCTHIPHTQKPTHPDPEEDQDPVPPSDRDSQDQPSPSATESLFARFWNAYPKKIGKARALRQWRKLQPSEGMTERLIAAVDTQAQSPEWTRENRRFVPAPARWLEEGRWDDEPVPHAPHVTGTEKPITAEERQRARRFRDSGGGYCRHEPQCASSSMCVGRIVRDWRRDEHAGLTFDEQEPEPLEEPSPDDP